MLVRVESPGGRMTGWRLTPADGIKEEDEVESLPVYAILAARPELLDAMLPPPGYLVLYPGDQLTTVVDENAHIGWDWTRDGDKPNDEGMTDTPDLIPRPQPPKPLLEPLE